MLTLNQPSFSGGEVSPSIYPRTDINKYHTSLRVCRNFIVHPTGGASNRCGMEYIASSKYADSLCVATEFIFNQTQAYVLEFGHLYVRFYTDGAQIQSNGSPYEVETPYLDVDLESLKFESSADVIFITHPDYQTRTLTRYGENDWRLETYEPDDGPFMPENIIESASLSVAATTGTTTLTVSSAIIVDTEVVFLSHFNGVDAATAATDDVGNVISFFGDAQLDTAQKKFGSASLLLDGTGDYLTVPDSNDWDFNSADFTVRAWVMLSSASADYTIVGNMDYRGSGSDGWSLLLESGGTVRFVAMYNPSTFSFGTNISGAHGMLAGVWNHIEVSRVGIVLKIFINGFQVATGSSTSIISSAYDLYIGRDPGATPGYFNGWIDELEIINGRAENTSNFTLPMAEYATYTVSAVTDFSFDSLHVGALFKLRHYVEGQKIAQAFSSATTSSSIKCFTTWRVITHGTWTGKFDIQKSVDGGTTWTVLRSFSSSDDFNANTSGTEDVESNPVPFLIRVNMYSYSSGTMNIDLTSDPFYQDGIVRATAFQSISALTVEVLQEVASTDNTTTWAEGSWSPYRGYPSIARFYQDRLCFANTPSEPMTIWMSQTSNYYSFLRNQTLLDTDGITVNIPSRQLNAINGLVAFKKLLAFTSASVWSVGPISGSALTPTSIQTDVEEYSGSANVNPMVSGSEAIYVQADNEVIKTIGYKFETDGFAGSETNILAKHLFEGHTVVKMAYQRRPNNVIWVLRDDGVLLGMTYMAEQEVVAWTRHDTDGEIESICVIPSETSDELWLVVNRDNGKFIEKMDGRRQHDIDEHIFMDSFTTVVSSTTVISAEHLANHIVNIIGDGVLLDTMTVSASGTLAMSSSYSVAQVGIAYNADLGTLSIDNATREGTIQGSMIMIGNVNFRVMNTRGGYVGPDENTLYEAFDYDKLNAENLIEYGVELGATENYTGDVRVPLGSEYKRAGRVFYRQSKPLPVTIGSISPEVEIGGRKS